MASQLLIKLLIASNNAPTESIGVRQVRVVNIDHEADENGEYSYNEITANDNTITFKCQATGREMTIDWSGATPVFTITG